MTSGWIMLFYSVNQANFYLSRKPPFDHVDSVSLSPARPRIK